LTDQNDGFFLRHCEPKHAPAKAGGEAIQRQALDCLASLEEIATPDRSRNPREGGDLVIT
jgi:hypothetical protein